MNLSKFETYELVEELQKREGVEAHQINPYEIEKFEIEGAAIVLVVVD